SLRHHTNACKSLIIEEANKFSPNKVIIGAVSNPEKALLTKPVSTFEKLGCDSFLELMEEVGGYDTKCVKFRSSAENPVYDDFGNVFAYDILYERDSVKVAIDFQS